jgi:hypothetical protein
MKPFVVPSFKGQDLEVELLDRHAFELCRLSKHPRGEWDPPDPKYRNLRVDPPAGHKDKFAVLYTAAPLLTIGVECKVLAVDPNNKWSLNEKHEAANKVTRYQFSNPGCFIKLDSDNRRKLGHLGLPVVRWI